MMRYISRPILHIPPKYKNQISKFLIDIRGSLSRDDIYFNYDDIQLLFGLTFNMAKDTKIVWMENDIDKVKYLCYSELINQFQLYRKIITHNRVFEFVSLVNTILDDDRYINMDLIDIEPQVTTMREPLVHVRDIQFESETESLTDSFSERYSIDSSINRPVEVNKYLILAYQHKIEMLTQLLDNKNTELQLKERDITIAQLQMEIELNKKNEIINQLIKKNDSELTKKNETIENLTKKIELLEANALWI